MNEEAGLTESERYLNSLAQRTFLNLWAYPNLFIGKELRGGASGKELCDLLVVCGDHVIIFSDKAVQWPSGSPQVAWDRWVKRSILKSAEQVKGARRWIEEHPDRIFLDAGCTRPFPLALPPREQMKVHGVVVASGAKEACRAYFGGGSGSLMIVPEIKGRDHIIGVGNERTPFQVGDVDPEGPFIHVFDEVTLDVAMYELDTITDFVTYLDRKAQFIRRGKLSVAAGEEDMIGYYIAHGRPDGEHDFVDDAGKSLDDYDFVAFEEGQYEDVKRNPQYQAKQKANIPSYAWDRLIELFTDHMIAGTTVTPEGDFELSSQEQGVRHMALVDRTQRRSHGEAVLGALERSRETPRFCRAMIPWDQKTDTGFFFLTLAVPPEGITDGYEGYRRARTNQLQIYAMGFLERYRFLKRIVGIATEPIEAVERSEDLILAMPPDWTEEAVRAVKADCERAGVLNEALAKETRFTVYEYPTEPVPVERERLTKRARKRMIGRSLGRKKNRRS